MGGGGSAWAGVAVRACGPKYSVFRFAWVGHIGLRLCDLIVHRCRPEGGAPPCRMANAGRCDYKKKKKNMNPQHDAKCSKCSVGVSMYYVVALGHELDKDPVLNIKLSEIATGTESFARLQQDAKSTDICIRRQGAKQLVPDA